MPRNRHRFQTPPPADPIAAARDSSLVFRLNIGFFLRQLGVFLVMDLLLLALASLGLFAYAENRCADVAALVLGGSALLEFERILHHRAAQRRPALRHHGGHLRHLLRPVLGGCGGSGLPGALPADQPVPQQPVHP